MSPPGQDPIGGGRKAPQKAKNFKKAWGSLLRFCKPYYLVAIIAFIFAIAGTVICVIGPSLVKEIISDVFKLAAIVGVYPTDSVISDILRVGTLLVILYAIMFVLSYIQQLIMATVTQRIAKRLRRDISKKINRLPLSYFDRTQTGDILSRITNDTDTLSQTLNQSGITLVSAVALLVGSIIMMFTLNWIMALTAIISSFGGFFVMGFVIKKSQKHFIAQQRQLGEINGHIEEFYTGHSIVKTCNAQKQVTNEFSALNNNLYQSAWKSQFYSGLMGPIMGFISNFSYICICIVGGLLLFTQGLDIGVIGAFMIYVGIFTQPLSQLAQAATNLQATAAASERVFEFLGEPEMENEDELAGLVSNIKGAVKFSDVKFSYTKGTPIIKGFSADIPAGSKIAVVGPTGAGKTTLVNLLMKFYNTDSGDIFIDGVPISKMRRGSVRDLFAMVLQDTWLFEGTVRENLAYNVPNVTDEQIKTACETAGIDHFIRTLPKGYDTVLDEQAAISNGQKQLLTIARAMIKNAPLLILDEATSSVDTRTEVLIAEAMDKLTRGRTSFVIAHRLSTIKNAGLILVLKDGDIIESGTHKDLIEQKGFYADLYNSQFSLQQPEAV